MANRIRKGYVDTSAGQVHYREVGQGSVLVLLHQSPSSSRMWEGVLPLLAEKGFRAMAFDMPGFGESDAPDQEPTCDVYMNTLLEAFTNLELGVFDLLGHHTGASVAILLAAEHPDRLRRLVLWGVPILKGDFRERLLNEKPPAYDLEGVEIGASWKRRVHMGAKPTPELALRHALEGLQTGMHRQWGHHAAAKLDVEPLLPRIKAPTLTMAGEGDQLYAESERAVSLLPNGRFHPIHGASLDVADEYPNEFVDAVAAFLRGG